MDRMSVARARRAESVGQEVRVEGWVRTRRDSKGFSFLELNDGSSFGNLQIIADAKLPNYETEIKHAGAGASVSVEGLIKASPAKGQATEMQASKVTVHGSVDETYPLAPNSPYPYAATKAQAEQLVTAANAPDFETIILRPRFIWGPGDTTLLPTIEAMAKSGGWMWVNHGRCMTSTTHVSNLVHATELALTKGKGGEAYFILDDGVRSMHEMITGIAASRGITLPEKSIPGWAADAMGAVSEIVWRSFSLKGEPPLTRFSAMILSRDCMLSDAKARREMGYGPVISVEDGLRALAS